jgi:trigger factor
LKVDVETLSETRRKLAIAVPAEDVRQQFTKAVADVAKTIQIPGFRTGRVPKSVVRARYGAAIKADVLQEVVPAACQEAVEEHDIVVVGEVTLEPALDDMELPGDGDEELAFTLEVEVKPALELPDYGSLQVDKNSPDVPQEEVEEYIERVRQARSTVEDLDEERPAATGDTVYVDWHVRLVGADEDYNHQHDYMTEVGGGSLFDEVDEALVGMAVGEEKSVRVTYPDDFGNDELAGKEADISVELKKLATRIVPELDDEFAKTMDFDDVEQMRANYWNRLIDMRKSEQRAQQERDIIDQLIEGTAFDVPEALVEDRQRDLLSREFGMRQQRGQSMDDVDMDKIVEDSKEAAERSVREEWILDEIGKNEEIEVDAAEVDQQIARDAAQSGMPEEQYAAQVEEGGRRDGYERFARDRQVFELLIERAAEKNIIVTP